MGWTCQQCTYDNIDDTHTSCAICGHNQCTLLTNLADYPSLIEFTEMNRVKLRLGTLITYVDKGVRGDRTNGIDDGTIRPPITSSLPHSVCICVSGSSFKSYHRRSILHCGVSDSSACVYNFDEKGYHRDIRWKECINIDLKHYINITDEEWDAALIKFELSLK